MNRAIRAAALVLALALSARVPARGETPEETFSRGNAAFEKGRYDEAAEAYRTVLRYGIKDARVEYNVGCAAFRLGQLGEAILHFERARRLAPTDPDVRANLEFARSRCYDRVEAPETAGPIRMVRTVQDTVGPGRQAAAVVLLVWLVAGLVAWRSSRPGGWNAAQGWVLAGLLLLLAVAAASWLATRDRLEGVQMAVVLKPSAEVRAGPGESNAVLFTVHEGLTIEVRSERQDWVQVSLPNGLNGWVPEEAVGKV
ncbi:MAG: tetratricopeptide repeat protein [Acidobacteriia bacterium]|nr:tetratricopeptide repeat protein [Terriglobia bacterium]